MDGQIDDEGPLAPAWATYDNGRSRGLRVLTRIRPNVEDRFLSGIALDQGDGSASPKSSGLVS